MSFREKSAWITFVTLFVFGLYFGEIALELLNPSRPHGNHFQLFVLLVVAMIIVEIVSHALVALSSLKDVRTSTDERERFIELQALRPAFYVLIVGAFLAVGTMHLGVSTWVLAHCVLFAIWIAELTRYATQLYYFRRSA